jgi:hypothetical protein
MRLRFVAGGAEPLRAASPFWTRISRIVPATPNASVLRSANARVPVRALALFAAAAAQKLEECLDAPQKKAIQRRVRSRRLAIRVIIGANPCFSGGRSCSRAAPPRLTVGSMAVLSDRPLRVVAGPILVVGPA